MNDRNMEFGIIKEMLRAEQREAVDIPLCGIMTILISSKAGRIIFLPAIFLSLLF
ncbi:hypothetical protein L0337_29360 [candidate division KSB1 bacterium]|nr:hypothetical protein [candidate division KSB1 bacterium]